MYSPLALLIYLLGTSALIALDIAVSKFLSAAGIETWATIRSLIGLSGFVCLIGLDQMIVRSRQSSFLICRLVAVQVPLLSIIVGTLIWWLEFMSNWSYSILLVAGSSATMFFQQYFRSNHLRVRAQVAEQGWKVVTLCIVSGSVIWNIQIMIDLAFITAIIGMIAVSSLSLLQSPPNKLFAQSPEPVSSLYAYGFRFMLSSILLALALYGEQLVVSGLGTSEESATYFTHAVFFLFPISIANGYFAFLIAPWLRDNHEKFLLIVSKYNWLIGFCALVYAISIHCIGLFAWMLIDPTGETSNVTLQFVFFCMCVARTIYTIPSAYIGIFGDKKRHDYLILCQLVVLCLVAGTFYGLYKTEVAQLIYIVAILSMTNVFLRTLLSLRIMQLLSQNRS